MSKKFFNFIHSRFKHFKSALRTYCKSATTRALHIDHVASPLVPREGDMMYPSRAQEFPVPSWCIPRLKANQTQSCFIDKR